MRSSAPKFLYPCYFGTDIDSQDNLVAWKHNDDELKTMLDVDSLGFLSTANVTKLADNTKLDFCTGCFTGEYPCPIPPHSGRSKYSGRIREE